VLVHEYPVEGVLQPVTVVSGAHEVGITTAPQQYVPPEPAVQAVSAGVAEPVQVYPVPPGQATVESVLHVSTDTVAEQPATESKRVKSPRTTNQEILMGRDYQSLASSEFIPTSFGLGVAARAYGLNVRSGTS